MRGAERMERGVAGPLPCLRTGSGKPLLFIGGLSPEAGVDATGTEWMVGALLAPFARRHEVVFVNRRPGLPRGSAPARCPGRPR